MRTFAATAADRARHRYELEARLDSRTRAGATALLARPEANKLFAQTVRLLLPREEVPLLALPASAHIIDAMETLGIVTQQGKITTVRLTPKGRQMAAKAQAGD